MLVHPGVAARARCPHEQRARAAPLAASPLVLLTPLGMLPLHPASTSCLRLQLGVKASCTMGTGCPPVEIQAEGLPSGSVSLSGSVSSQYLTALLMAAPLATGAGAWGGWHGAAAGTLLVMPRPLVTLLPLGLVPRLPCAAIVLSCCHARWCTHIKSAAG